MEDVSLNPEYGTPPDNIPATRMTVGGVQYSYRISHPHGDPTFDFIDDTHDNTHYQIDISNCLPTSLVQTLGSRATPLPPAHHQSIFDRKPSWWRAQCAFRGISTNGTRQQMQKRILAYGADRGMDAGVREIYETLRREYLKSVEKFWSGATNDTRAQLWPKRLLHEALLQPAAKEKTIAVQVKDWGNEMERLCREMNLISKIEKMDYHGTGGRLAVVGLSEDAVYSRYREIRREADRAAQRARRLREEKERDAENEFRRRFKAACSKEKTSKDWDVHGKWRVNCGSVEKEWANDYGGRKEDAIHVGMCSLQLRTTNPDKYGLAQMYAVFDFIAFTGFMRFLPRETPKPEKGRPKQAATKHSDRWRDSGAEVDDNEDDEDDEDDEGEDPPTAFAFPASLLPSTEQKAFSFRWRGEETGEGEIQLDADRNVCSLTFESPNALTGEFISCHTGKVTFQGIKVPGLVGPRRPDDEWEKRSEHAYGAARVLRWH